MICIAPGGSWQCFGRRRTFSTPARPPSPGRRWSTTSRTRRSGTRTSSGAGMRRCRKTREAPLRDNGAIAGLHGSLPPDGAVVKPAAASKELLVHRGRAVVFDSIEDLHARIDDPDLDIDETCVLVLRGCGPKGYPGMPEAANTPLPPKLLARGVRDLIRISDARMSGTAYGTVVLHVPPESAAGGPLSLVQDGDMIVLDVPGRRLDLDVPPEELLARRPSEAAGAAYTEPLRGWQRLYVDHVMQADRGADLDFLVGSSGDEVTRDSH